MSNYRMDREHWFQLNIYEQMGNIGAEVGRAIKAKRNKKPERIDSAIDRALDLFDATTEQLVQEHSPRLREVLRARNEFLRLFYDDTFETESEGLERYFTQFAIAANRMRK